MQYKVVVAYDGTDYYGWQKQPDVPTIASILEQRFKSVFKKDIHLIGASRTDAGVHALGQVASFSLDTPISADNLLRAWNNALPPAIVIRSLEEVEEFHPQRYVKEKTYYYHFFEQRPLPYRARFGYFNGPVDAQKLRSALQLFEGTHDFRSFCTGYEAESTIRTIRAISLVQYRHMSRIIVQGPGFLRHMIRRIVGGCLEIASSSRPIELLSVALAEKSSHQHLFVAPPQGLMLYRIEYDGEDSCKDLKERGK
jgi:tRNA pseudouridine38-40 synthase